MFKNAIAYPLSGLISLIIGLIIINAGLNVHSGEIFLWLIGIFGFLLFMPLIFLVKSIQLLMGMKNEESKIKTTTFILSIILGLSWVTLMTVAIWKEL